MCCITVGHVLQINAQLSQNLRHPISALFGGQILKVHEAWKMSLFKVSTGNQTNLILKAQKQLSCAGICPLYHHLH